MNFQTPTGGIFLKFLLHKRVFHIPVSSHYLNCTVVSLAAAVQ